MNNSWDTPQIILSIYAACISTIALLWNIVLAILDKSPRFKVKVEFRDSMTGGDGKIIRGPTVLYIRIVNASRFSKYINDINIKLPYKTSHGKLFSLIKFNVKMPIELKPEQEFIYKFTFVGDSEMMLGNFKVGKCQVIIADTVRKRYKSNKFSSKKIKETFEFNNSLSRDILGLFNGI